MDRTIKFLLGVIAASLVMLNLQLAGVSLVKEAHAERFTSEWDSVTRRLKAVQMDISTLSLSLLQLKKSSEEDRASTNRWRVLDRVLYQRTMCLDSPTCRQFSPHLNKKAIQRGLDDVDKGHPVPLYKLQMGLDQITGEE